MKNLLSLLPLAACSSNELPTTPAWDEERRLQRRLASWIGLKIRETTLRFETAEGTVDMEYFLFLLISFDFISFIYCLLSPAVAGCGYGTQTTNPVWDRDCNVDGCQGCTYFYDPTVFAGMTIYTMPDTGIDQPAPSAPWNDGEWAWFAGTPIGSASTAAVSVMHTTKFQSSKNAMRVVRAMTWTQGVLEGQCRTKFGTGHEGPAVLGADFAFGAQCKDTSIQPGDFVSKLGKILLFHMGGQYQICVSDDGEFSSRQGSASTTGATGLAEQVMHVAGIFDKCRDPLPGDEVPECLGQKPYHCWLGKNSHNVAGGCVIDFFDENGASGVYGEYGKAWFTDVYDQITYTVGHDIEDLTTVAKDKQKPCAGAMGSNIFETVLPLDVDATHRVTLPRTVNDLSGTAQLKGFNPKAVSLCYCPGGSAVRTCDQPTSHTQQIGVLYFWNVQVCDPMTADCGRDIQGFRGVIAANTFQLSVGCPWDQCIQPRDDLDKVVLTHISKVKIVEPHANNDLPSWDPNSGCRTATHTSHYSSPGETYDQQTGGIREKYRVFPYQGVNGGTPGWLWYLEAGAYLYEERKFHQEKHFDVCFCFKECTNMDNWFKVGAFGVAPSRLVSHDSSSGVAEVEKHVPALNHVMTPGSFGLYADSDTAQDAFGNSANGVMMLVPEAHINSTDLDKSCRPAGGDTELFNPDLMDACVNPEVGGTQTNRVPYTAPNALKCHAGMTQQTGDAMHDKKIIFNANGPTATGTTAGQFPNAMVVKHTGVFGICYCSKTNEGRTGCADPSYFKLIGAMTIRGPVFDQEWTFSTNVVFRFEFHGFGLMSTYDPIQNIYTGNTVRILSANSAADPTNPHSACESNGNNPNTAETSISTNCPDCQDVSNNPGQMEDIQVQTLTQSTVGCNERHLGCSTSSVRTITVLSDDLTLVNFTMAPGLLTGDSLVMTGNIQCKPKEVSPTCTEEKLAVLMGTYPYADDPTQSHFVSHIVTKVAEDAYTIPIGWPITNDPVLGDIRPEFEAIYDSSTSLWGMWQAPNRAITREEIKGASAKAKLVVCWGYGGANTYRAKVGVLNFVDAAVMSNAIISLSAPILDVKAPVVLSFRTGQAEAGSKYTNSLGRQRLLISLLDTTHLDLFKSDDNGQRLIANSDQERLDQASQSVCGAIFRELWSSDRENGFPVPMGCYFKIIGDCTGSGDCKREVSMVFETKNGLKADTDYQMVFNARVSTGETNPQISIFTFADVDRDPYNTIEFGKVRFNSKNMAMSKAANSDPQMHSTNGCRVMSGMIQDTPTGGDGGLNEMKPQTPLVVQLRGPGGDEAQDKGPITAGCFLRLTLWPLTLWETADACSAKCHAYEPGKCDDESKKIRGETCGKCGAPGETMSCYAESVVPNAFQTNMIIMQLPFLDVEPIKDVIRPAIEINHITLPETGFFGTRMGCEIRNPQNMAPSYDITWGDSIWRRPVDGQATAKIASMMSSGNDNPFAGAPFNILYLRLAFPATMHSTESIGAYFYLDLPPGYECLSATEGVPMDLTVHGSHVPQGRGTLNPKGWSYGADGMPNRCRYEVQESHLYAAQSSIMIGMKVKSPSQPLTQTDITNRWQMVAACKGWYSAYTELPPIPFSAADEAGKYSSNVAVVADLQMTGIQPHSWFRSTSGFKVTHTLYVFFTAIQNSASRPFVQVIAPEIFDFSDPTYSTLTYEYEKPCIVNDVDQMYYSTWLAYRLPGYKVGRNNRCHCTSTRANRRGAEPITKQEAHFLPQNIAYVGVVESIQPGRSYAFGLDVSNPQEYSADHQNGWRLFIIDEEKKNVDGTASTVRWDSQSTEPGAMNSWHMYGNYVSHIDNFRFTVDNMLPSSMREMKASYLNVCWKLPTTFSAEVRFTAPVGFAYSKPGKDFNALEFVYHAKGKTGGRDAKDGFPTVPCAMQNFHAPKHVQDHYMIWDKFDFDWQHEDTPAETTPQWYGFITPLIIPDHMFALQYYAYSLEFGFNSSHIDHRPYAVSIPADPVRALGYFDVDYGWNREGKVNLITVQIQVTTPIPAGGSLRLVPPDHRTDECPECEFSVPDLTADGMDKDECFLHEPAPSHSGDTYTPLGAHGTGWKCTYGVDPELSTPTLDVKSMKIVATTGLGRGLYRWSVEVINPRMIYTAKQAPGWTKCNYDYCWAMYSMSAPIPPRPELGQNEITFEQLDLEAFTPAFDIFGRLPEARLINDAELTQGGEDISGDVRRAIKRNDRPVSRTNLIFSIKLSNDVKDQVASGPLTIRAPAGFVFDEDCKSSIELRKSKVFGSEDLMPNQISFAEWEEIVTPTACVGVKSDMFLYLTAGLKGDATYVFRIGSLTTASATPKLNKWLVSYNKEVAELIDGYQLYSFTDARIETVSTMRTPVVDVATNIRPTVITIFFTPYNEVNPDKPFPNAGGCLRVLAPEGYMFVRSTDNELSFVCEAHLRRTNYTDKFGNEVIADEFWEKALGCEVRHVDDDEKDQRIVHLPIIGDKIIEPGLPYELILSVWNPETFDENDPIPMWTLESFDDYSGTNVDYNLDYVEMSGHKVNQVMKKLRVMNKDMVTGLPVLNGRYPVLGVLIWMVLPHRLDSGDCLHFEAPTGFSLTEDDPLTNEPIRYDWTDPLTGDNIPFKCNNFVGDVGPFSKNNICTDNFDTCEDRRARILCNGNTMKICITIATMYQESTDIKLRIDTMNPSKTPIVSENNWVVMHISKNDEIRSSHLFPSWTVVPQLENVKVQLMGPHKRAGAFSTLRVVFDAVSAADSLRITALQPDGIDFTQAKIMGFEIKEAMGRNIEFSMTIKETMRITMDIENVRLGSPGGQAIFSVTSMLVMQTQDEALQVMAFRQPGVVKMVKSDLQSQYKEFSSLYPIKSMGGPQLTAPEQTGKWHKAVMEFTISMDVQAGERLNVTSHGANPYKFFQGDEAAAIDFFGAWFDQMVEDYPYGKSEFPADVVKTDLYALELQYADGPRAGQRISTTRVSIQESSEQVVVNEFLSAGTTFDLGNGKFLYEPNHYRLLVRCQTPAAMPHMEDGWLISFEDDDEGGNPTNTNDGTFAGFALDKEVEFTVGSFHTPPRGMIDINVDIIPCKGYNDRAGCSLEDLGTPYSHLLVIAPLGFVFAEDCLVTVTQDFVACRRDVPMNGRDTAVLTATNGQLKDRTTNLYILAKAPDFTPKDRAWHMWAVTGGHFARTAAETVPWAEVGGRHLAWGADNLGFPVTQMKSSVQYAGIQGFQTYMSVYFETSQLLQPGAYIDIEKPEKFVLICTGVNDYGDPHYQRLNMPEASSCQSIPQYARIFVNETFMNGPHAFIVSAEIPTRWEPNENKVTIIVRNHKDEVMDAIIDHATAPIEYGVKMKATPFQWSSATGGSSTVIQNIGFEVLKEEVGLEFGAFVISFPQNYEHLIMIEDDVKLLADSAKNSSLPIKSIDWKDDRIRFILDSRSDQQLLKTGLYQFKFPVMVPDQSPAYLVWHITFCRAKNVDIASYCWETQGGPASANAIPPGSNVPDETWFTFPIAGFRNGQSSSGWDTHDGSNAGAISVVPPLAIAAGSYFAMRP